MTPLLPLEDFRRVLGWNPFHFWGLSNALVPVTQACPSVLKEYAWQHVDAAGRDDIRHALESAESLLKDYLNYAIAPEYVEQTLPWARYYDNSRDRVVSFDATGRWIAPRVPGAGYVQAVGIEQLTLVATAIKSDPPAPGDTLVFSDQDGDGIDDTFTITLPTSETDPERLAVYFVAADRLDQQPVGAAWRVQPVEVQIAGGVATLIGRIWLLVRPVKYQGVNTQPLDPSNLGATGPYAQSLAVYIRSTNPDGNTADTGMATLIWETTPCHGWWCCCSGCTSASYDPNGSVLDPAATASAVARVSLRDARLGELGVGEAVLNPDTGIWSAVPWDVCREPDRFTIRYLAGYPLEGGDVGRKWHTIVARLAMAELARPVCSCEAANRELYRWQFDLGRSAGANDEVYGYVTREQLNNPLGTRRGQLYAWQQIRNLRQTPGVTGF